MRDTQFNLQYTMYHWTVNMDNVV